MNTTMILDDYKERIVDGVLHECVLLGPYKISIENKNELEILRQNVTHQLLEEFIFNRFIVDYEIHKYNIDDDNIYVIWSIVCEV